MMGVLPSQRHGVSGATTLTVSKTIEVTALTPHCLGQQRQRLVSPRASDGDENCVSELNTEVSEQAELQVEIYHKNKAGKTGRNGMELRSWEGFP